MPNHCSTTAPGRAPLQPANHRKPSFGARFESLLAAPCSLHGQQRTAKQFQMREKVVMAPSYSDRHYHCNTLSLFGLTSLIQSIQSQPLKSKTLPQTSKNTSKGG